MDGADAESTEESAESAAPSVRQGALLSLLNPMRLFRRQSAATLVADGQTLLDNASLNQALVVFNQALALDADCIPAYRGLAKVYLKRGGASNLAVALSHYQEAIRRKPMEQDLYAQSAKVYDALGKRKEATLERKKFMIVRALEADPRNRVANNNMGILFLQQGRVEEALDYFGRAILSDRSYDVAYRNQAAAYMQLAKKAETDQERAELTQKARIAIQKALDISATLPTLLSLARILMMAGTLEEVLKVLDRADKLKAANPEVYLMKKMALEGLGRYEEARNAKESYEMFRKQAAAATPAPARK